MPFYARVDSTLRSDWAKAMGVVGEGLVHSVQEATKDGAQELRVTRRFRDRSGDAYRSIDGKLDSVTQFGAEGSITAGNSGKLRYVKFLASGTKAHFIEARRARALRFVAGGQLLFRKSVQHPGTKPSLFVDRGARVAEQRLGKGIAEALAEAGKEIP